MRLKSLSCLILFLILTSCQKKDAVVRRENEPDIHLLRSEDKEMNNAIESAQKSLYKFKEAIKSKNPNYYNFALKERFGTDDGGGEHIWISEIQYDGEKFHGIVDGDPISTKQVKFGDTIEVNFKNITDWMYFDKNTVKGSFTTRVLRKRMSKDELNKMDRESGVTFEKE